VHRGQTEDCLLVPAAQQLYAVVHLCKWQLLCLMYVRNGAVRCTNSGCTELVLVSLNYRGIILAMERFGCVLAIIRTVKQNDICRSDGKVL